MGADRETAGQISIHVPRTGHDHTIDGDTTMLMIFQSTCPVQGTTRGRAGGRRGAEISIHVPRTGHDDALFHLSHHRGISIHVPRTGHDRGAGRCGESTGISIHVPRTGHDEMRIVHEVQYMIFQSTCPVQGTTRTSYANTAGSTNFNPRAPYRARRQIKLNLPRASNFNPRAPYRARQQKCTNSILHFCNSRQ